MPKLAFLSSLATLTSCVSQREPICAIILQRWMKYPTASKNRNWGEFTAELKVIFSSRGWGYISRTCPGQAEHPAVRQTHKDGRKPGPTLIRRCIKIENRNRNQTLSIRLTQSEKSAIISKAKKFKLTLTEYILKSSFKTQIKVIDLQLLLVELKRIGNNLNQITRKINSGAFNSYNFSEMIAMQRKIYDAIINLSEEK